MKQFTKIECPVVILSRETLSDIDETLTYLKGLVEESKTGTSEKCILSGLFLKGVFDLHYFAAVGVNCEAALLHLKKEEENEKALSGH
ncbi:MAG: hypothetical protein SGJ18_15100 [Pseudomonadota bacterium]|nr:hypothetical protein [Pseudomonadota bacterium]